MTTPYENLLKAAETLLDRRDGQIVHRAHLDALKAAIAAARRDRGEDENLVPLDCDCPQCGERLMDRLTWVDDDNVRCQTCGKQYEPHAEKETADDHHA